MNENRFYFKIDLPTADMIYWCEIKQSSFDHFTGRTYGARGTVSIVYYKQCYSYGVQDCASLKLCLL